MTQWSYVKIHFQSGMVPNFNFGLFGRGKNGHDDNYDLYVGVYSPGPRGTLAGNTLFHFTYKR